MTDTDPSWEFPVEVERVAFGEWIAWWRPPGFHGHEGCRTFTRAGALRAMRRRIRQHIRREQSRTVETIRVDP